jgi:hypothetical protein
VSGEEFGSSLPGSVVRCTMMAAALLLTFDADAI